MNTNTPIAKAIKTLAEANIEGIQFTGQTELEPEWHKRAPRCTKSVSGKLPSQTHHFSIREEDRYETIVSTFEYTPTEKNVKFVEEMRATPNREATLLSVITNFLEANQ